MQIELHNLATTDELTKLYNRRYFIKVSKNELKRARRYKRSVSFLLIDLDYFKIVNDTYGHPAGDEVLIQAASIGISTCSSERYAITDKNDILLEQLLSEADKALYKAKEEGRNKIVAYDISLKDPLN